MQYLSNSELIVNYLQATCRLSCAGSFCLSEHAVILFSGVDPFFGSGGGGGAKVRKMPQKKLARSACKVAIKLRTERTAKMKIVYTCVAWYFYVKFNGFCNLHDSAF